MSKTATRMSDVQNALVRVILWKIGEAPDSFSRLKAAEPAAIAAFGGLCGYCRKRKPVAFDHAVPINRNHLGRHCIGNRIPICQQCNNEKGGKRDFRDFLRDRPNGQKRIGEIVQYTRDSGYTPLKDDPRFRALIEAAQSLIDLARTDLSVLADKCVTDLNNLLLPNAVPVVTPR